MFEMRGERTRTVQYWVAVYPLPFHPFTASRPRQALCQLVIRWYCSPLLEPQRCSAGRAEPSRRMLPFLSGRGPSTSTRRNRQRTKSSKTLKVRAPGVRWRQAAVVEVRRVEPAKLPTSPGAAGEGPGHGVGGEVAGRAAR